MPRSKAKCIADVFQPHRKVAQYLRVSSSGQELGLQEATNSKYLTDFNKEDIIDFVDDNVSATKLSIEERPALNRMLHFIKEGKISTIIVYERDRLARDVYEYIQIVTLFYKFNVKVIFTASNSPEFSDDLFTEAWYGLTAQFEGQKIKTRLSDARKRNPSQIIGYKKVKSTDSNSLKQTKFVAIADMKDIIKQMFIDISEIDEEKDLFNIIIRYQPLLNRKDTRIIDILKTPFFSGHYIDSSNATFVQLPNVEPIITVELFKKVQVVLEQFERDIDNGISFSQKETIVKPQCSLCKQELKFKKGLIGSPGSYVWRKHKKISIEVSELDDLTSELIENTSYFFFKNRKNYQDCYQQAAHSTQKTLQADSNRT
ncbi:recombinase family protein [Bacillus sp. 1P06AnD]|uniref:recombinase family protein n=1 Tax=Bacillus sp. 1P06AnD TaxID=3132208 RepID=UPI0039A2B285